jgi:hypothetical protein
MKILVQNCLNHRYLKSLQEWTADASEAKNFSTSESALAFCTRHKLPAVHIVLKFDPDRYDITVPITKECEQTGEQNALLN